MIKTIIKKTGGILLILLSLILFTNALFTKTNIFSNGYEIFQGIKKDFDWQQFSYYGTMFFLNIIFVLIGFYFLKTGVKILKSKTEKTKIS